MFLFVLYKWLNETVYVLSLRTNRHNVASTVASAATSCIFCWIFFFYRLYEGDRRRICVAENASARGLETDQQQFILEKHFHT